MRYVGEKKKIEWQGKIILEQGYMMLHVEDVTTGKLVPMAISIGNVVPENWIDKRVKIVVEHLESS